jgi:transglutaminase-like putative cysteine protease
MRLTIRHETRYNYEQPPAYAVQRLYLTPSDFDTQRTVSWKIDAPGIERALGYRDGYGNQVHVITLGGTREQVLITAEGTVDCENAQGVVRGLPTSVPDPVYLRQTKATAPNAGMRHLGDKARQADCLGQLHAIMLAIHERVAYELGATHAHTTAAEAFEDGRGVCQDHAHIFIGTARALGIPSRYVTGYLVTEAGQTATASHAWAEALVPGLGWVGFDAANGICPTDHYVRVAGGIDATSVAPVRGTRRGGAGETMMVEVSVQAAEQ